MWPLLGSFLPQRASCVIFSEHKSKHTLLGERKGRLLSAKSCFLFCPCSRAGPHRTGLRYPTNPLYRREAELAGAALNGTRADRVRFWGHGANLNSGGWRVPLDVSAHQMRATLLDYGASSARAALGSSRRRKCRRTTGCAANAAALNNRSAVVAPQG